MLFLAVTLGFFVENYREHHVERNREKEFLRQILQDVDMDLKLIETNIGYRNIRAGICEELTRMFQRKDYLTRTEPFYLQARRINVRFYFERSDAGFQQLKNAGGLRLIHNSAIVTAIQRYDQTVATIGKFQDSEIVANVEYRNASALVLDAQVVVTMNARKVSNYDAFIEPPGDRLAVGSGFVDSKIHLLDASSGREIASLSGQRAWTGGLAFLADGKGLISGSADQVIRLWDVESRAVVRSFRGHKTEVRAVAVSGDGRTLVSGCKDGSAFLWRVDADRANAVKGDFVVDAVYELTSRVWTFDVGGAAVITLTADGRLIRREGRRFEQETTLLKFDVAMKGKNDPEIPGVTRYNLIFDQGRPRVAFADPRGRIQVWDWEQRKLVREWEARTEYNETSLSWFSADGRRLALTSFNSTNRARHYREWEIATGLEKRAIPLPEIGLENSRWLESSSDGNGFLLLGKGQTESVRYDFAASRYLPLPQLNLRQSARPRTSPDGRLIFSPSYIGEVRVFDSQSLRETAALRGFMFSARGIAFSEDGQRLITGSTAQEVATLWDLRNFERLLTLPTSASASGYVGISPDGNVLVGDAGGTIFFWRAPSFEEIAKAETAAAAEERNFNSR